MQAKRWGWALVVVAVSAPLPVARAIAAGEAQGSTPAVVAGHPGEGPARDISLTPHGVAVDGTSLVVTDADHHVVRRIDPITGTASLLAGDGSPTDALDRPGGVVVDVLSRHAYVADELRHQVSRLHLDTGELTVVAGTGTAGFSGDGGPAREAQLSTPRQMVLHGQRLFVADRDNGRVRSIDLDTGVITTFAGTGPHQMPSGDGGFAVDAAIPAPRGLAADLFGNVYISGWLEIRKVNAAGLISTFATSGGEALAVDVENRLWVAREDGIVRYAPSGGAPDRVTAHGQGGSGDGGPALRASVNHPLGLAFDPAGTAYIADTGNWRVRRIDATATMSTVAGNGLRSFSGDGGPATEAQLDDIAALWADDFGVAVAEKEGGRVRGIAPDGTIGTLVGKRAGGPYRQAWDRETKPNAVARTRDGRLVVGGPVLEIENAQGRLGLLPDLNHIDKLALDCADRIYASSGSRIYMVRANERTTVVVGGGHSTGEGLLGPDVGLLGPGGVAVDTEGRLVWTETVRVRRLDHDGRVRTIASGSGLADLRGLAVDAAGSIYVAEGESNRVRKFVPGGSVATVVDGLSSPTTIAIDAQGDLFVDDARSRRVLKVAGAAAPGPRCATPPAIAPAQPVVSPVAGTRGSGAALQLSIKGGPMAVSGATLYIGDWADSVVRAIDLRTLDTTIVAGNGTRGSRGDRGPATAAQLDLRSYGTFGDAALATGPDGSLFVGEIENRRVRKVRTDGTIDSVVGGGRITTNWNDAPADGAQVQPKGIAVGLDGTLYLTDRHEPAVRAVSPSGEISHLAAVDGKAMTRLPDGDLVVALTNGGTKRITPSGVVTHFSDSSGTALAAAPDGSVYALRYHEVVRIDPTGATATRVAGTGESGRGAAEGRATEVPLSHPSGIAVGDDGVLYIGEADSVRRVGPDGWMTTIAGNRDAISGDGGPATKAQFWLPNDAVVDRLGRIVVGDEAGRIRRIDTDGRITTIAGRAPRGIDERSGNGGPALDAVFKNPRGIGADAFGNVYVADTFRSEVRRIDQSGTVSRLAGVPQPLGIAGDCLGTLWVGSQLNGTLHRLTLTGVQVAVHDIGIGNTTSGMGGIDVDAGGNVYVADSWDNVIRRLSPGGTATIVAGRLGGGGLGGDGGPATSASLHGPTDVAVDIAGNLWIADSANNRVRRVDRHGIMTTVAGFGADSAGGDGGPALDADLPTPTRLALDRDGNLYVTTGDARVRKIAGVAPGGSPCQNPTLLPGLPLSVTAAPGDGSAVVSWAPPASPGGGPVRRYTVTVSPGGVRLDAASTARSLIVPALGNGLGYSFTVSAANDYGEGWGTPTAATVTPKARPRSGYWMVDRTGHVYAFGDARHHGGLDGRRSDVDHIEPTPSGNGYWLLTSAGEVVPYGDARWSGDAMGRLPAGETATSMSARPNGGYWVFTSGGRAFAYGGAPHFGDMGGTALNGPVLGSVATPSGNGYYMVASDGGIFTFGDARFHGSMGGHRLNGPVVGLAPDPDGVGYWLVGTDGGIFTFESGFRGSMGGKPLNRPMVGMVAHGDGYLMVGSDGGIFSFSTKPFSGSLGGSPPAHAVVAVASLTT